MLGEPVYRPWCPLLLPLHPRQQDHTLGPVSCVCVMLLARSLTDLLHLQVQENGVAPVGTLPMRGGSFAHESRDQLLMSVVLCFVEKVL